MSDERTTRTFMEGLQRLRRAKKAGISEGSPLMLSTRANLEVEAAAGKIRLAQSKAIREARSRKPLQMRLFA